MSKRPKGSPRPGKETARRLRAMAANIPDQEFLDLFIGQWPKEMQAEVKAMIVPYVRFYQKDNAGSQDR